jgi:tRNA pseudouridine38-40 synthase
MRIALGVEYDGTSFKGWQSQPGEKTIQAALEKAVSKIADHPVSLTCAGRTDAGVHACAHVVHFDTEALRPMHAWVMGCNSELPRTIAVQWAQEVSDDFHARFSALSRTYRYVILNRHTPSPLLHSYTLWCFHPLDEHRMQEAANHLLGEHDFSSFRAQDCQAPSAIRCVHAISVKRQQDFVIIEIKANAFLQHMVRNIVGSLVLVGRDERSSAWLKEVLLVRDRTKAGYTAGPEGLYFVSAEYLPEFHLPLIARSDERLPMIENITK